MLSRIIRRTVSPFCSAAPGLSMNLTRYLNQECGWEEDCENVVKMLHRCGFIYAKDPRHDFTKSSRLQETLEHYFAIRSRQFEEGDRNLDVCLDEIKVGLKENYHQLKDAYVEEKIQLKDEHLAITPMYPKIDPTWRYHWLLGADRNLVPTDFPDFPEIMESWGKELLQTNITICEMTAIALGLEKDAITKTFVNGSNYISPPACDLTKNKVGDVITGFHRDFGLLTTHTPTRFDGMYAWLLTGEKVRVKVPEGYLLVQGGKQLEWMTGGYIKAGFHEVIHDKKVESQVKDNLRSGKSNWRVACAMFSYVQGNLRLKPFPQFNKSGVDKIYPSVSAEDYLKEELKEDWKRGAKKM